MPLGTKIFWSENFYATKVSIKRLKAVYKTNKTDARHIEIYIRYNEITLRILTSNYQSSFPKIVVVEQDPVSVHPIEIKRQKATKNRK